MVELRPVALRLVDENWLDRVPAPAYDSLTPSQRRDFRDTHPESYLNVTRSPEDDPSGRGVQNHTYLAEGRAALERLLAAGAFTDRSEPAYYLYRLELDGHSQVGIVAEVSVDSYASGDMRIHEEIRQTRADLLADHLAVVRASSSPVAIGFRGSDELSAELERLTTGEPIIDLSDDSGLRQSVWCVYEHADVAALGAVIGDVPMYIVDGHHRAAAALAAANRAGEGHGITMFVAAFADDSLQLLGFNRWIRERAGDSAADSLSSVEGLEPVDAQPEASLGVIGLYADGQWYRYALDIGEGAHFDAVAVRDQLLGPVFGIHAGDDDRLVNLAGDQSVDSLVATIDEHGGVAVVMAPIEIDAFMAAADQGIVLPPKSTYFTPKVRSGLFLREY